MRFVKIILMLVVVVIAVAIVAGIIFVKTFDINRFKPQIISEVGKALNREVDFERAGLGFSLRQGISLKIANLSVSDDPVFGKDNFFAVKNVSLAVNLLKLVFDKEVNVPNVLIDSPRITIIRKKDGSINASTIAQSSRAQKPEAVTAAVALPAILLSSIKGNNGVLTFVDQTFQPPLNVDISELSFSLSDVSLTRPFPFVAEGSVLSAKKNVKLEGNAQINLKTGEVIISELKGTTQLADILLEKIPVAFPMIKTAVLPVSVDGRLDLLINNLTAVAGGLTTIAGEVSLSSGSLKLKEMSLPIKDGNIHMNITEKDLIIDKASFSVGQGIINASGSVKDYLLRQEYNIEGDAKNLLIQDLIAQDKSPVKAEGLVSGKIKLNGQGFSPEALKSALSADALLSVIQARLKDINVLRTVLDKISVIPGLAQRVEEGLSQRYKEKLTQKDTAISDISLPVSLKNGNITVDNISLGADEFLFNGSGQAGLDSSYSIEGLFLIPQELSASMGMQVSELQYLFNNDKQISIPLKISGKAGEPKFSVDAEYIAEKLLKDQLKQQIFKALDKALGTEEQTPTETQQNTPATQENIQQPDAKKPTTEDIVTDVLDSIFKK